MIASSCRVLVTGGAGFIGSHLVDALVARGDSVRVVDDLSVGAWVNVSQHERVTGLGPLLHHHHRGKAAHEMLALVAQGGDVLPCVADFFRRVPLKKEEPELIGLRLGSLRRSDFGELRHRSFERCDAGFIRLQRTIVNTRIDDLSVKMIIQSTASADTQWFLGSE